MIIANIIVIDFRVSSKIICRRSLPGSSSYLDG